MVKKHPHVRGEDTGVPASHAAKLETPPRAWGRRLSCMCLSWLIRNTPTCVGKTSLVQEYPPLT